MPTAPISKVTDPRHADEDAEAGAEEVHHSQKRGEVEPPDGIGVLGVEADTRGGYPPVLPIFPREFGDPSESDAAEPR